MNETTMIIAALAVIAATFAVLFFLSRKNVRKYEGRAGTLVKELSDVRSELARVESSSEDAKTRLTKDNLVEFLLMEKAGEVEVVEEANIIIFNTDGEQYIFEYGKLPHLLTIRKGYSGMKDDDCHWDILQRAAAKTSETIAMLKMHVYVNEGFDYTIESSTHTVAGLREDWDMFVAFFAIAEEKHKDEYRKILEKEHPEECADERDGEESKAEDLAVRMARMIGGHKKVQS